MKEKKKYTTPEIVMLIFCASGCLLMVAPKFIDTAYNLFPLALALNGIGLAAFVYSRK